jgi:hypothetical protein
MHAAIGRLAAVTIVLALGCLGSAPTSEAPFAVVAYVPEWRYEGMHWDNLAQTATHILLFSLEPTADGGITALDRLPRPAIFELAREAARRHGSRLLVCFGGNGRSAGFAPMVRAAASRARFVAALVDLCHKHRLDGVDYNWCRV